MIRVHVLVEGQTEEAFVERVLNPHFQPRGLHLTPILLATRRRKDGRKFRGGLTGFGQLRRDLQNLLGDSSVARVTTMIDYYGLPDDFPGRQDPTSGGVTERVQHLQESLAEDLGDPRLLPYLSVHEFEALVLADPDALARSMPEARPESLDELRDLLADRSPEEINDGETTHPSARLAAWLPRYRKTLHGPTVTARIGLARLRTACPHFDGWLRQLENVAGGDTD